MRPRWITKLSSELELKEHDQDWGICNSDPRRIREFISYYRANTPDHEWEPEALAELIFQSWEDAEDSGPMDPPLRNELMEFISKHSIEFPRTFNYWSSLQGAEWHIPKLIAKIQNA